MQRYVLGFLHDNYEVVLIQKQRPDWQKGLLNGVGGKIEEGERPLAAMIREFKEETGHLYKGWFHFATMRFDEAEVLCYVGRGLPRQCITMTDEKICIVPVHLVDRHETIDNVPWLLTMGRSMDRLGGSKFGHCHIDYSHTSRDTCCAGS